MYRLDDETPGDRCSGLYRLLRIAVDVRPGETRAMLWGALYYFSLMASYYTLRPIRDEIGARDGAEGLSELFTATFIVMLLAVPVFSWLVSRISRRKLLPWVYFFFTLNLVGFYVLFEYFEAPLQRGTFLDRNGNWWTAVGYFVWVSVFNLFVVSVFWGFMADLFRAEQGKRLFGFIAFGASLGAIVGAAIPSFLSEVMGLHIMLISAALLMVAVVCIGALSRLAHDQDAAIALSSGAAQEKKPEGVGGGWWEAFTTVARSPYLIGIASFILFYTASSTMLYFIQAEVVDNAFKDRETRTAVFGRIDLAVNILSMVVQIFLTGRIMARLGVTVTLIVLPVVTLIGFIVLVTVARGVPEGTLWLGMTPILVAFVPFQVIRRASNYGLSKVAREVLFTVVTRAEKYKAKVFIDTAIYRGGDVATAWALEPLLALWGMIAVMAVGIPVTLGWMAVAVGLGRAQVRRQSEQERFEPVAPANAGPGT